MVKGHPVPLHLIALRENLREVRGLTDIHEKLSGTGRGRRFGLEILHKSSIVLLVACWEAYVEDLALGGFDFMLDRVKHPMMLPSTVLNVASRDIRTEDPVRMWTLAGTGWRSIL